MEMTDTKAMQELERIEQEYLDIISHSQHEYLAWDKNVESFTHIYNYRPFPPYRLKKIGEGTDIVATNVNERGESIVGEYYAFYFYMKDLMRLSPDRIDSIAFWTWLDMNFPFASFTGDFRVRDTTQMVIMSLNIPAAYNFFPYLEHMLQSIRFENKSLNLLEIGYGYGGLAFMSDQMNNMSHMNSGNENNDDNNDMTNDNPHTISYTGIDILNRTNGSDKRFKLCNGHDIPEKVKELYSSNSNYNGCDMIVSFNTFQHLSVFQKTSYMEQGYKILKRGGKFIFTDNVITDDNVGDTCWGCRDYKGRCYTHFFGQFTPCESYYEIVDKATAMSYELELFDVKELNKGYFIFNKK